MKRDDNRGTSMIIFDMLSVLLAYIFSCHFCFGSIGVIWKMGIYRIGIIISMLVYLCIDVISESKIDFYKRGYILEAIDVIKKNIGAAACTVILLFLSRISNVYSRSFWGMNLIVCIIVMYFLRVIQKHIVLRYYENKRHTRKLMIVSTKGRYRSDFDKMKEQLPVDYEIIGLCVLDEDMEGQYFENTPIVSNEEDLYDFLRLAAVDEVFISAPGYPVEMLESIILTLEHMGIVVNLNIRTFGLFPKEKMLNSFGGFNVLTYSTKMFQRRSLIIKRIIDIIGAIPGMALTILVSIVIIPMIRIESKGPAIFSQIRIGKNGRRFRMYKFRSMYVDAEKRKKELMDQNEMEGFMFKITDDPRITKVGKFIRRTSIDELPQFFNVLRGDMSLVGTRPPTLDEFEQYDNEHKRRLSIKPGITGLWQVSGRSDITNFEDVVKLDLEYIDNWNVLSDLRIMWKTFRVVADGAGSK